MKADELKQLLESGLPEANVTIKGDGDHFEAIVVSGQFEGKNMIQQHRMVYEILGDRMQGEIHALALHTYTPEGWASERRLQ